LGVQAAFCAYGCGLEISTRMLPSGCLCVLTWAGGGFTLPLSAWGGILAASGAAQAVNANMPAV